MCIRLFFLVLFLNFFKKKRELIIYSIFWFLYSFRIFFSKAFQLQLIYEEDIFINFVINLTQERKNLIHCFFLMISYLSYYFSKCLKNFVILCSSKCKTFKNFEVSINIIYRTVKGMMNENNTLEVKIKDVFYNDKSI